MVEKHINDSRGRLKTAGTGMNEQGTRRSIGINTAEHVEGPNRLQTRLDSTDRLMDRIKEKRSSKRAATERGKRINEGD